MSGPELDTYTVGAHNSHENTVKTVEFNGDEQTCAKHVRRQKKVPRDTEI